MRFFHFLIMVTTMLSILLSTWAIDPTTEPGVTELHSCANSDVSECPRDDPYEINSMPVGATYMKKLDLYKVGPQVIRLHITKTDEAKLVVRGAVPINDNLKFNVEGEALTITMSQNLKGILSRYFVTLSKIRYDSTKDCPSVFVRIFGIISFPVKLERIN